MSAMDYIALHEGNISFSHLKYFSLLETILGTFSNISFHIERYVFGTETIARVNYSQPNQTATSRWISRLAANCVLNSFLSLKNAILYCPYLKRPVHMYMLGSYIRCVSTRHPSAQNIYFAVHSHTFSSKYTLLSPFHPPLLLSQLLYRLISFISATYRYFTNLSSVRACKLLFPSTMSYYPIRGVQI